jgi:acetylornithine/N-succinyldiaminopimelate aminotransferase
VFFCNSGAEANEGAIKLARKYAWRRHKNKFKIICAADSFHGRTLTTLTATGAPKYQEGFSPLPPGFLHIPFGDVPALEKVMGEDVCAVLLEPIKGEGGVNVPPPGYLPAVRDLCDKYAALLILDEIQTGIGRTGRWFGFQQENVRPDVVTLAKGLGSGFPIGALLASEDAASGFGPGDHGSTFGGGPLACAAANTVLSVIEEESLVEAAARLGDYFKEKLRALQRAYPSIINEIRGRGLLVGIDLSRPGKPLLDACLTRGLIVNCTAEHVLRLVPPLIVKEEEIDFALGVLSAALRESEETNG